MTKKDEVFDLVSDVATSLAAHDYKTAGNAREVNQIQLVACGVAYELGLDAVSSDQQQEIREQVKEYCDQVRFEHKKGVC